MNEPSLENLMQHVRTLTYKAEMLSNTCYSAYEDMDSLRVEISWALQELKEKLGGSNDEE